MALFLVGAYHTTVFLALLVKDQSSLWDTLSSVVRPSVRPSVHPSVRPSGSPSVSHSFPHFSLTCFDILSWNFANHFLLEDSIKLECRQFPSIFVGVMPLLELKILEIHSFLHFSPICFDILGWNFAYDFVIPSQQRGRGYSNAAVGGWLGEWVDGCVRECVRPSVRRALPCGHDSFTLWTP